MILKHEARYNRAKDIANKIEEESKELQEALKDGETYDVVNEALDLITVCLNAIYTEGYDIDIEQTVKVHQQKLKNRGWKAEKFVNFRISENE